MTVSLRQYTSDRENGYHVQEMYRGRLLLDTPSELVRAPAGRRCGCGTILSTYNVQGACGPCIRQATLLGASE